MSILGSRIFSTYLGNVTDHEIVRSEDNDKVKTKVIQNTISAKILDITYANQLILASLMSVSNTVWLYAIGFPYC